MSIRKAGVEDVSRMAEILVFSKRKNYRDIFNPGWIKIIEKDLKIEPDEVRVPAETYFLVNCKASRTKYGV